MTTKTMPLGEKLATDIRSVADALGALADSIAGATPAKVPAGDDSSGREATPQPAPITLETVRVVLADKARAGFTAQVRELLQKHGAERLSDIDPAKYPEMLKDAEGLKNG